MNKKFLIKVERNQNILGTIKLEYIVVLEDGNHERTIDIRQNIEEAVIVELEAKANFNNKFINSLTQDKVNDLALINAEKIAKSKLQRKSVATKAAVAVVVVLLAGTLFKIAIKAPTIARGLDLSNNTVELQKAFSVQEMVDEVNLMGELLARHGIERNDNKLFSFYFVNNIQYFDEELTELLIEEKLLPDTAEKILNDYNGVFNDIMNHNLKAIYQNKGQAIEFNNFVKDDFDKAFIGVVDKETADIFNAPTNDAGNEEYQEAKAIILGIKATSDNDTIHEMSAGAQFLSTYAQGVMTVVHGTRKSVSQADLKTFEGIIEAARADIHAYMTSFCPSLESTGKTK